VQNKVVLAVKAGLFLFFGLGVYLLISNLMLRQTLKKITKTAVTSKNQDAQKHKKIEEGIIRDMEEKYRADMISYQVVAKRLEQEQNRQKNLREGIRQAEKIK